ncbi:MAG: ccmA [Hyphomicrobiales bacterium]|nr:ccmA [Hyphomicrobiales bacterium]
MRPDLQVLNQQGPFAAIQATCENLGVGRGGRLLIENLNFSLENGRALVVAGPNGAGKSTLLRAFAGLLPPAMGRWSLVAGASDAQEPGALAHYLGHAEASKPALTARENLEFWRAMLAIPGPASLHTPDSALAALGAPQIVDLPVAYLSAGQRRRVALARLLLAPRPLWILDEPLTALDAAGQALLNTLMREHLSLGGILIAATHAPLGVEALQLTLGAEGAA